MKNIYTLIFMNFHRLAWGILFLFVGMASAMAQPWTGGTTPITPTENTYLVTSANQLAWIASQVNAGTTFSGKTFYLTTNLDMNGSNYPWTPIGNATHSFQGTFNGQYSGTNYTISNVTVTGPNSGVDYNGLFGYVSNAAILQNITLTGINISGYNYVGGLVAYISSSGSISNCTIGGTVTDNGNNSTSYVGSLVGYTTGTLSISSCSSSATVNGAKNLGGLIGSLNSSGAVQTCSSSGTVTSDGDSSGGLIGSVNSSATFTSCTYSGNFTAGGTHNNAGGLFGTITAAATLSNCSFSGNFSGGNTYIGGIVGSVTAAAQFTACYSTGQITNGTTYKLGGFVGYVSGGATFTNCYTTGSIYSGSTPVGGFVGQIDAVSTFTGCYATGSLTTDNSNSGGFVGLINANASITNCYETGSIACTNNPAGGFAATVQNCTTQMSGCYATGNVSSTSVTGGFIGVLTSSMPIANCYATGNVSGGNGLGGFIGTSASTSSIANCFAIGMVVGQYTLGGFIGSNATGSAIVNCYATGPVISSGGNLFGGFIGSAAGTIANCYATGTVYGNSATWAYGGFVGTNNSATFAYCYFDTQSTGATQASGQGNSTNITGLTTAQMITSSGPGLVNGSPYGTANQVWVFTSGFYPQLYNFKNGTGSSYSITSPAAITVPALTTSSDMQAWSALSTAPLNLNTADNTVTVAHNFTTPMTSPANGSLALTWGGAYQSTDAGRLSFSNDAAGDISLLKTGTATFVAIDAGGRDKPFFIKITSVTNSGGGLGTNPPYIYVRQGGKGAKTGVDWADALPSVQEAVEIATAYSPAPAVWVAAGDYYRDPGQNSTTDYAPYNVVTGKNWNGIANNFVMRDGVNVYGAFPENGNSTNSDASGYVADMTTRLPMSSLALYKTTLHGTDGPGDNTPNQRVLGVPYSNVFPAPATKFTTSTKWDGFTLTGANMTSTTVVDQFCGGGAFTIPNDTLSDCIIENNTVGGLTNDGGGVLMAGGALKRCIIRNNTANGSAGSMGAGICMSNGGCVVINCLIYNNQGTAATGGSGIIYQPAAGSAATASYLINNTVANNNPTVANTQYNQSGGTVYLYNNAFYFNYVNVASGTFTENYNAWPSGEYSFTKNTTSYNLSTSNTSSVPSGTVIPWFGYPTTNANANYRLQSTSGLINIGGTNGQTTGNLIPTNDIRRMTRTSPVDIGCYEYLTVRYFVNSSTGKDEASYGINWTTPMKTIQYALDMYDPFDYPQVWVAAGSGSYIPSKNASGTVSTGSDATFALKKNLSVYGGFAGNQSTEFPATESAVTGILNARNLKTNKTVLSGSTTSSTSVVSYNSSDYSHSNALLDGFTITGAASGSYAVQVPDSSTVENCKIIINGGGGLSPGNATNAYNILVADNGAIGINLTGVNAKIINATIANNTGVGIYSSSSPTVTNSIVWGNSANLGGAGTPSITYSAAASNYGINAWPSGTGNIDLLQRTPNFKNPLNTTIPNRNYELLLISPCLGTPISPNKTSANPLSIDANGNPRLYNSTIDMGAFEKMDGYMVTGSSSITLYRTSTTYPVATFASTIATLANKANVEVQVTPGAILAIGSTPMYSHWLELMQDSTSTLPGQLTSGNFTADSVLYVRRFSKTLSGTGVWTFFGIPFGTAPLSALDGGIDENTVRIETYNEATRAQNGPNTTAWIAGRLSATSTMNQGTGYALSFNSKVPQTDVGQTVIFSTPHASSPFTFTETGTPTYPVTLAASSSGTPAPHWYDCGWNLIANPLPQTAGINAMWASTSKSAYGAAYFYKQYSDSYDVYPYTYLSTRSNAIAPNAAFFVQTDVGGATATFTAGAGTGTPLVNMDFVRPVLSSNATDATTASAATVQPATFQFKVTGGGDYCNTFVIFDPGAHADMEPMEDNPTMEGITAQLALQLSTTATGSATSLAINRLPFTGSTMQVPMQVYAPIAGSYTITMPVSDTIAETVLLQDSTGGLHNLTTGSYTFTTTTDKVTNNYIVIFTGKNASSLVAKGVSIIQDQRNVIVSSISTMQRVALYGEGGQTYYLQNPSSTQVTLQLPPTPGVYLLKVVTAEGVITKKLVNRE
jgi:hypothetical protein